MIRNALRSTILATVAAAIGPTLIGITSDGISYRFEGRGPGVVLIHGFHMDLREWDDVSERLAVSRRVLRYDVRGHGRSTVRTPPPSSSSDLLGLLDELNVSRATVVGLSMGATIALEFALRHSERVERLVLVSPGIPGIPVNADREWMKPIAEAVRRGNPRRAAELWWESPILAGVQLGARADRYRAIVLENAAIWTVPRRPPPLVPPAGTRLQEIAMPVLAVAGDRDRSGSVETAQRLASSVQRGRLHIISGAGHMLSLERPDDVARLVLEAAVNRATER